MAVVAEKKRKDVEYLALSLPNGGFTDDVFYELCQLNDDLKFEGENGGVYRKRLPIGLVNRPL